MQLQKCSFYIKVCLYVVARLFLMVARVFCIHLGLGLGYDLNPSLVFSSPYKSCSGFMLCSCLLTGSICCYSTVNYTYWMCSGSRIIEYTSQTQEITNEWESLENAYNGKCGGKQFYTCGLISVTEMDICYFMGHACV